MHHIFGCSYNLRDENYNHYEKNDAKNHEQQASLHGQKTYQVKNKLRVQVGCCLMLMEREMAGQCRELNSLVIRKNREYQV